MRLIESESLVMPKQVKELYEAAFPVEERRIWNPRPQGLALRMAYEQEIFAGFITCWHLDESVTYVEHFAILPELRGRNIGGEIIDSLTGNLLLEVELPEDETARRRVGFYERHGFKAHEDLPYMQPPYSPGLPEVPMMLMTRGDVNLARVVPELRRVVYGVK